MLLLLLIGFGWWRETSVGPQIQVPMFYDAHYLFPRAWTQEQAAPGVPEDAPLAFYGQNRISQPFISAVDNLAMIELWLAGAPDEVVIFSLADDQGQVFNGEIILIKGLDGEDYKLSFPPIKNSQGRRFMLTMAALAATVEQPVVTRTVGGDRLGGSLQLNEYNRPGNLSLKSYARGWPGWWWFASIGEQILPSVFRLRLQQYKPSTFKGLVFPLLLGVTILLTVVYLVLARPKARPSLSALKQTVGWTLVLILGLFLMWQVIGGRVKLPIMNKSQVLEIVDTQLEEAPGPGSGDRIVRDISSDLWTLEREPGERFISSEMFSGLPGIRVPSNSAINYGLHVPPDALLRGGIVAEGQGDVNFEVQINGEVVKTQEMTALTLPDGEDVTRFQVDLSPWAGQASVIRLATSSDQSDLVGLWIMPQIESTSPWLMSDSQIGSADTHPGGYRFDDTVELIGYMANPSSVKAGDTTELALYWRPLQTTGANATVFIHLVDDEGNLIAQHDSQPVNDAYPLPLWQPDTVIRDTHQLTLPADLPVGQYKLYVGLYNPDSLQRWPVVGPDGSVSVDHAALLDVPIEVMP